jgi:hypothetical protein
MLAISPVAVIYMLVTGGNGVANNQIAPARTAATAAITLSLLRILFVRYANASLRLARLFRMDYRCHDIPIDEEERCRGSRMPRQNIRIDSWTEQECYDFTSFTGDQLRRIFGLFGLAQLAAQTDGYIRVFTGHGYYRFDPEEIFLFMLTKCRTGKSNRELCDLVFGGSSSRWSFGYPWILVYLDTRYARTISHEKLRDFVDEFPVFYDAINRFIQKPTVHHFTDGSAEECDGLIFLPFSIFGFIDCSIDRISRPFSGPDGDYIGAPRKAMHHAAQRSVYTGYKKCHGIKVETVMLPNGISTVYGPTSARIHDVGGVLQMSGLDNFLMLIQQGRPDIYSAFGDSTYNAQYLQCIRSYYISLIPGVDITDDQKICNDRIKPCRQAIEWSYGDIENIFQICSHPRNYRLGKRLPCATEQLRVCHLLSNIYYLHVP